MIEIVRCAGRFSQTPLRFGGFRDQIMTSILEAEGGTTNYWIDRLKIHLAKVVGLETKSLSLRELVERSFFGDRKYYNQAFNMLRIGAYKPVPFFIINLSDLTEELRKELSSLDRESRQFVLKQAVGRIFEDINCTLFHNSISRVLRVRFEK